MSAPLRVALVEVADDDLLPGHDPRLGVDHELVAVEGELDDRVGHAAVVEVALQEVEPGALVVHEPAAGVRLDGLVHLIHEVVEGRPRLGSHSELLRLLDPLTERRRGDALPVAADEPEEALGGNPIDFL